MTTPSPYVLIKPPRSGRPCRAYPKRNRPRTAGSVHWMLPPKRSSAPRLACVGPVRSGSLSYAASADTELVTCRRCLEQIAGRVEGALCR